MVRSVPRRPGGCAIGLVDRISINHAQPKGWIDRKVGPPRSSVADPIGPADLDRSVGRTRQYERGPDSRFHDGLLMDLMADELA